MGKKVGMRPGPLLKIISQNEKRAKKKGAAHSLIFHCAYKGWPLCGGRCVYAAESPRAVSCAAFLAFWLECW